MTDEPGFLMDPDTNQARIEVFNQVLPVMNALASNPNTTVTQLEEVTHLVEDEVEWELFPDFFKSEEIPVFSLDERRSLAGRMMEHYQTVARHPNADWRVLELT